MQPRIPCVHHDAAVSLKLVPVQTAVMRDYHCNLRQQSARETKQIGGRRRWHQHERYEGVLNENGLRMFKLTSAEARPSFMLTLRIPFSLACARVSPCETHDAQPRRQQTRQRSYFDFRNERVVIHDVRAHLLQQGPNVKRGGFATVSHVCLG